MSTNPFLPWLPMYAPGTLAERPMWRRERAADGWRRADGLRIVERLGPALQVFLGAQPAEVAEYHAAGATAHALAAMMDRLDTTHPVPSPPPMVGQVWSFGETERAVASVWGGLAWFQAEVGEPRPADTGIVYARTEAWGADVWPPPNSVLVAGPTPWGRDVPWYPKGWKP